MFHTKQVIYFPTFFFKNGAAPKSKYFIILGVDNGKIIIASLPTSLNNAPSLISINHGCIELPERQFNCYVFEPNKIICDNGFSFPLPTFIYGNQVEYYANENFEDAYKIAGVDYIIKCILNYTEFKAILNCVIKSGATKKLIKKLLLNSK